MSRHQPLLVVQAHLADDVLPEFNRWFEDVHYQTIMSIPGVVKGRRCYPAKGHPNYFAVFVMEDRSVVQSALSSDEASVARQQWTRWIPYIEEGSLQVSVFATITGAVALFQNN
jgi:hypothetical protein